MILPVRGATTATIDVTWSIYYYCSIGTW